MDTLERLAGRLAQDLSRLEPAGGVEGISETANLVLEVTKRLAADHRGDAERLEQRVPVARGTETILLVDGEREDRLPVRDFLVEQGYTVLEAADGSSAIETAERWTGPVHLLLTNVLLPDMSGRELAERLALVRPEIGLLYMSGYADAEMLYYGLLSPGAPTVAKPVRHSELAQKVRTAIHAPQYA